MNTYIQAVKKTYSITNLIAIATTWLLVGVVVFSCQRAFGYEMPVVDNYVAQKSDSGDLVTTYYAHEKESGRSMLYKQDDRWLLAIVNTQKPICDVLQRYGKGTYQVNRTWVVFNTFCTSVHGDAVLTLTPDRKSDVDIYAFDDIVKRYEFMFVFIDRFTAVVHTGGSE